MFGILKNAVFQVVCFLQFTEYGKAFFVIIYVSLFFIFYHCYVTDALKQCDTVERDVMIPWNPDSETINITTNSTAGSNEKVNVYFYDRDGSGAGSVFFGFYTQSKYWLNGCKGSWIPFPNTLPTETNKTWTIAYNYTEMRVVYYCNEVQVLNVVISDSVCKTDINWRNSWGRKPTQIKFHSGDTASDSYCISSNKGKYNGGY